MWGHGCFSKVGFKKCCPQRCATRRDFASVRCFPLFHDDHSVFVSLVSLLSFCIRADIWLAGMANKAFVCIYGRCLLTQ